MLVQFTSHAYESITMFEKVALRLLTMMGQSGAIPGAVKAEQVPQVLGQLQRALSNEQEYIPPSNSDDEEPYISLSQRAFPLVNMLKAAAKKQEDILWDYQ